jgi:nucleoid-associated protein EbfC
MISTWERDELSDSEQGGLGALAQRARQLQDEMSRVGSDLRALEAKGFGGGGVVTATVSGEGRLVALQIDSSAIDSGDPESLAAMVITAVNGANEAVAEQRKERVTALTDGLQDVITQLRPPRPEGQRVVPRFPLRRLPTSPPGPDGQAEGATGP